MGSYHGVNRIIRLAYYENPGYVPLLRRSYELWRQLEQESGEQLLYITGSVDASAPDGEVFEGSLNSCRIHDIPHEILTSTELSRRFPGFQLPSEHLALYQQDGGFLASERCVVAHVNGAVAAGAEFRARQRVLGWEPEGHGVAVRTQSHTWHADRLVLSAGAWMGSLLSHWRHCCSLSGKCWPGFSPIAGAVRARPFSGIQLTVR